jgi:Alpha-kinase family
MVSFASSFAFSVRGDPVQDQPVLRRNEFRAPMSGESIDTAALLEAAKETTERLASELHHSDTSGRERAELKERLANALVEYKALKGRHDAELVARVEVAERRVVIAQALRAVEQADRVNLAFLFDATSSVQPHIDAVKAQIRSLARRVISTSPNVELQVAFVAYRDHCDGAKRFEKHTFSSSISAFEAALERVVANGGGDVPEDVHGGLQQALTLDWECNGAATRLLIHIADCPCHGTAYHTFGAAGDTYAAGDPYGLRAVDLLTALSERQVEYIFGRLTEYTDLMIKAFNAELKGEYITVCDMANTAGITHTVCTAARGSMARTASALKTGTSKKLVRSKPSSGLGGLEGSWEGADAAAWGAPPATAHRVFTVSTEPVDWSAQEACPVVLYTNDPVTSMDQLRDNKSWKLWSRRAEPTDGTHPQDVRLKVAPQPFAQGALRWAFKSLIKLDGWQDAIVKLFKDSSRRMNTRAQYLAQIEISTIAAFLAEEYDKVKQPQHLPITFFKSHVVEVTKVDGSKEHYNLERELPPSEVGFTKFSNNTGYWNTDHFDSTLAMFSQWTYAVTGKYMMVTDLQGVKTDTGYFLTDPVVLCHDLSKYGSTNLGPKFIDRCMHSIETLLAEAVYASATCTIDHSADTDWQMKQERDSK